jgi:predicted DNA-binding protein (UPF0251 family)
MNNIPDPLDPKRLEQAASALRLDEREVLRLSAAERLCFDQIAVRLGIGRDEVERLLATAICKLDRALELQRRPWWKFW